MVDMVVSRADQPDVIGRILTMLMDKAPRRAAE